MKPIIGISLDYSEEKTFAQRPWYALRFDYIEAIYHYGAIPILIPYIKEYAEKYINIIDGLLIPGGDRDIDPKLYGESIKYSEVNPESKRAEFEIELLKLATKKNIPVLGICNGMQIMNVAFGGTLVQHIPYEVENCLEHKKPSPKEQFAHEINIIKNTKLSTLARSEKLKVNSSHHQSVKKLGNGMVISAIASDGVIEAIEHPEYKFFIGCEWHPEYLVDNGIDQELFQEFIRLSLS